MTCNIAECHSDVSSSEHYSRQKRNSDYVYIYDIVSEQRQASMSGLLSVSQQFWLDQGRVTVLTFRLKLWVTWPDQNCNYISNFEVRAVSGQITCRLVVIITTESGPACMASRSIIMDRMTALILSSSVREWVHTVWTHALTLDDKCHYHKIMSYSRVTKRQTWMGGELQRCKSHVSWRRLSGAKQITVVHEVWQSTMLR